MKSVMIAVFSLIISVINYPSFGATCPDDHSPPKVSLMIEGREYPINDSANVIQKAFSKIDAKKANNVIVYIHGRGQEPGKSKEEVIPYLEQEYTASVIMFHWCPSWVGKTGDFPYENAEAAADEFAVFIKALKNFLDQHQQYSAIPVTLLSHSMGAFVLEAFSRRDFGPLPTNMFATIVLSAAAVDADGHADWLNKLDGSNHIYVMINDHDFMLSVLAKGAKGGRLGQKLETMMGREIELAEQVKYVDITKIGKKKHQYFIKSGQNNNPLLRAFFQAVLNGKPADLSGATIERQQIYILK